MPRIFMKSKPDHMTPLSSLHYKRSLRSLTIAFLGLSLAYVAACSSTKGKPTEKADIVFYGGPILTMELGADSLAEAVAVKDGKILYVGTRAGSEAYQGETTELRDLKGKALLPGFIDAHSHLTSMVGLGDAVDLSPGPYGSVNNIPELQKALRERLKKDSLAKDIPLLGNGYDDAIMEEHRHPTRAELDAVSTEQPILIMHASGHVSVVNTAMLKLLEINESVRDPEGGHYGRYPKSNKLNGRLEENANFNVLGKLMTLMPQPKTKQEALEKQIQELVKAQALWISHGQTTVCDGRTMGSNIDLLKSAAAGHFLKVDVIYFPDYPRHSNELGSMKTDYMKYRDRLKLGGFKFSNDGSPQGKTAWLTKPYLIPPEGKDSSYAGFPIFEDSVLYAGLHCLFQQKITAQLHVNGDAAIDQALRVIGQLKKEGLYTESLRATLIHVQNSRPDHIAKIKEVGLIPSYFSAHVYLWGDWHLNSVFGPERSAYLSPAKAALDAGIPFTIHHDAPVTPPSLLTGVYAAVNRMTRTGVVLGADQRITVMDALRAITINAAYQYHEEYDKGSIAVGKLADLVILDQNPLTIDPKKLRELKVVETIKEGQTLFKL